jgi:hypothetical protein
MSFAFNPDDGPARLIRYVDPGTLPGLDILALYDRTTNLLIIDRVHFAKLTETEKQLTLKTQRSCLTAERPHKSLAV